jgi:DNA polymerase/3'-5' exonuclease PolX
MSRLPKPFKGWAKLQTMVDEGEDLTALPGIGDDLARKIMQLLNHEVLPLVRELNQKVPESVIHLLHLPGLGCYLLNYTIRDPGQI